VVAAGLAALAGHIWPLAAGARRKGRGTGPGHACSAFGCRPWVWPARPVSGTPDASAGSSRSRGVGGRPLSLFRFDAGQLHNLPDRPAAGAYLALAVLTTVLVVWRHRANLGRLIAGTETESWAANPATN